MFEPVRSAEPPISSRQLRAERFERRLRCLARGHARRRRPRLARSRRRRARGQSAGRSPFMRRSNSAASSGCARVARERAFHSASQHRRRASRAIPGRTDVVRNLERRILPAERLARAAATSSAPSAAPCVASVPCLFGAPQPMIVLQQISDGRSVCACAPSIAACDRVGIVAVDVRHHVPAVGLEALRRVVGEPALDLAVDRDAVVVVEARSACRASSVPASEQASCEMPSIRQPSPTKHVGVVVDDRVTVAVELRRRAVSRRAPCRPRWRGPGRAARWWSRCRASDRAPDDPRVLRAAAGGSCLSSSMREVVAGQVQQRVQQHRAVAVRQHEAVAVGPVRIRRGCAAGSRSTAPRRCRPCPSACRDGRNWRPGRHPWRARGWRWRAGGAAAASRSRDLDSCSLPLMGCSSRAEKLAARTRGSARLRGGGSGNGGNCSCTAAARRKKASGGSRAG